MFDIAHFKTYLYRESPAKFRKYMDESVTEFIVFKHFSYYYKTSGFSSEEGFFEHLIMHEDYLLSGEDVQCLI